ncbi:hypothetical protein AGDE_15295 [Angomonas deanei]|nr:hypothetical protein AGDE_15295 [Angomonas deanei]|eukprot:EPY19322.1 hypothetical protein AGDE_15295 [Angomonas deanei]
MLIDASKRNYDKLEEENCNIQEEMKTVFERQKGELAEAEKKIDELTQAKTESTVLKAERNSLLDKYYDLSTCECDLIGLYKYCKLYRVPEDVRRSVLAEDTREELTLLATLKKDIRRGSVREFLEWMVTPLPCLKRVTGPKAVTGLFDSVESCYVQYKKGIVPLSLLKSYCKDYGIKRLYNFTTESLLTVTAVVTCLEYFTTVLPLLPGVTCVKFPPSKDCTLPEDPRTMIGGGSVREFLTAVMELLPEPKSVKGFYGDLHEYHLAYKAGDISHDVLKAVCEGWSGSDLVVGTSQQLSAGISLRDYCEIMLPLMPKFTGIGVMDEVDNIDWCATLPETITAVDVRDCKAIEDFTPLLVMKGLQHVWYNKDTNPSFHTVIDQLKNKGVLLQER